MACDPCSQPCEPAENDPCDTLWGRLETIRDCLGEATEKSAGGGVCRLSIVQGTQAIMDTCCAGFAWVRVVETYPSVAFPARKAGAEFCDTYSMAAQIEIGIARCQPTFDDQTGEPPTVEELEQAAMIAQSDRTQMHRMLRCCLGPELGLCKKLEIGSWTPIPEAGMCGGGTLRFAIPYTDYVCLNRDGEDCCP